MNPEKTISWDYIKRLAIFAVLTLNLGIAFSYAITWFSAGKQGLFWRADFTMLYTGGTIIREGQGSRLYDFDLQAETQQRILDERSFSEGLLPYDYPPHVAILITPFTLLPQSKAYLLWTIIQIVLLIWLIRTLLQLMAGWTKLERWLAISAVLAFPPLLVNFLLGALSLLMTLSILQFYTQLKNNRKNQAAFWLLLTSLKPTFLVFPGIILLASRDWKIFWKVVIGGFLILLGLSAVLGWHIWLDFTNQVLQISKYYGVHGFHPELMHNLRGTLSLLLGKDRLEVINSISIIFLALGLLFCFFIWRGKVKPQDPDFDLRMAITIMLIPLLSLHAYSQDSLVVILAGLIAYHYFRVNNKRQKRTFPFLLLYPFLVLISDYVIGDQLSVRLTVIAMIIFTAWLVVILLDKSNLQNLMMNSNSTSETNGSL